VPDPTSIYVGFVVDKVALRQVLLRVTRLYPVNIIPPTLHTLHLDVAFTEGTTGRSAETFQKSNELSANGENWIETYFRLVFKWLNKDKYRNTFPIYCNIQFLGQVAIKFNLRTYNLNTGEILKSAVVL